MSLRFKWAVERVAERADLGPSQAILPVIPKFSLYLHFCKNLGLLIDMHTVEKVTSKIKSALLTNWSQWNY